VSALAPADINLDGRPGVALFYADRKPMVFFNRGFACFGWARELDVDAETHSLGGADEAFADLEGMKALLGGQSAGLLADLDGDSLPDLVAVSARGHQVWVVTSQRPADSPVRLLEIAAAPALAGPVTLTVREGERVAGMVVVRPGRPVRISRTQAGPVVLEWTGLDGQARRQQVVVTGRHHRVELTP